VSIELDKIHIGEDASLFIRGSISWDTLSKAEFKANEIVSRNLDVKVCEMTRAAAKRKHVRAKFDRIKSEKVRVVELLGFDAAACSGLHVKNTSEIGFIAITHVLSHGKDSYELRFDVGDSAKSFVFGLLGKTRNAMHMLNADDESFLKSVENLVHENERLKHDVARLSASALDAVKAEKFGFYTIYKSETPYVNSRELMEKAGELIKGNKVIVVFKSGDMILIARSDDIGLNMAKIMQQLGKGGGKQNFAMGQTSKSADEVFMIIKRFF
jgi:alanyl-tRNA synthetase